MNARLDPLVSEFETEEQAASYDRWFRAKVQAAIDDPRPSVPHDEVMARMEALLNERKAAGQVAASSACLDPLISEFETEEQAASHDRWFRAKVQAAIESEKPRLPHDAALARVDALLEARRKQRAVD